MAEGWPMTNNRELDAKIVELDLKRDEPRPPAFSDEALAQRFAELHANDLRYVAAWGRWLSWDGRRWTLDETLAAYDLVRKICRAAAAECNKGKIATALASAKTVAAVERLARSDRRLAATVDQWDIDPWLLNTPAGIVDLRTGKLLPHRAGAYMTKITGVAPEPSPTPTWQAFLERITGGDLELVAFLNRTAGYCLTGLTTEHALFFVYGTGANGKSTFINAVTAAAGDYHRTAPIETFTTSSQERHPTDLAGLRGARFVTSVETEEGRRWAESKIKALTGGDKIAARFMRQDFFEFTPAFKIMIAGNHKPSLRSVDEAMRRRIHLVPFAVAIPEQERDKNLGDRLRDEWPGILAWMIAGCIEWQERSLAPPEAVASATRAYLESEDAMAAWIEDKGFRDPNGWETTTDLFTSWKAWATHAGEEAGTMKRFVSHMEARGLMPERRKYGRGFRGMKLNPPVVDGYGMRDPYG
jgi:putative DNA primase/helicase